MLTLRPHSSDDYARLPNIDARNVGMLSKDDRACLDELGNYLVLADAHERFGATLLHSHFPVRRGETFVEEVEFDSQTIRLRPVSDNPSDIFAVNVCLEEAEAGTEVPESRLIGLEFAPAEALGDISPICEADSEVLIGIRQILTRHGKTRRFGVRLLHDPLQLAGRVLLETCDPASRVLTCRPTDSDDPLFARSIPTVFQWERASYHDQDGMVVSQECVQFCKSTKACVALPDGSHQGSSSHDPVHGEGPQ
jgi:hypothetical protein